MTTDRATTIADSVILPPELRSWIASGYRELAEANAVLGLDALAPYCSDRADALEFGGIITLGSLFAGGTP